MQEIHILIESDSSFAKEMVLLDIRNTQAHKELVEFSNNRQFLIIHPITINRQTEQMSFSSLVKALSERPEKFLQEVANVEQNIRRIESNIRTKKHRTPDELKSWMENLERAKIKREVIISIISK